MLEISIRGVYYFCKKIKNMEQAKTTSSLVSIPRSQGLIYRGCVFTRTDE